MEELVFQEDLLGIYVNVHQDMPEEIVLKKVSKDYFWNLTTVRELYYARNTWEVDLLKLNSHIWSNLFPSKKNG